MNAIYKKRAHWEMRFSVIPRRCNISGRRLWGWHYRGCYNLSGPGDPIPLIFWHHRDEHLIYKLKGE